MMVLFWCKIRGENKDPKTKANKTKGEELLILLFALCNDATIDSDSSYILLFVGASCISAPAIVSSCFVVGVSPGLFISPSSPSPSTPTSFLAASALSSKSIGQKSKQNYFYISYSTRLNSFFF